MHKSRVNVLIRTFPKYVTCANTCINIDFD